MADTGPWNPFPAVQDYQIGQQTIEANKQTIEANRMAAIADQQDQAINADAAQYMATIAKGGTIPGQPDIDNAPKSMSAAFTATAQHLIQLGAPKKAMEFIKAAGELDKQEMDAATKQSTLQKNNADMQIKQADLVGRYLGDAQSQEDWDNGLKTMEDSGAFTPEQMQHFRAVPFHESTAHVMKEQSLSAKDKASLANQAADNDRADRALASSQAARDRAQTLAQHRSDEADRLRAIAEKTGKAATAPSEQDIKQVSDVIVNQIFKGVHPGKADPALRAGAATVAARAKAMCQQDKSLDWATAMSRAVAESQVEGDWDTQIGEKHLFSADDPDKTTFNDAGKNKRSPMALPPKGTKPQANKYYSTSRGVAKWNGKQFVPVE